MTHGTSLLSARCVARSISVWILACAILAPTAGAQTRIDEAWVRGTVAEQKATGLFATITSSKGGTLVSASSPLAGVVEIHEMRMDRDIMRMRAVARLDLPAGKPVQFKPGGLHIMLMDLKQPLKAGDTVKLTLVVEAADKTRETIEVQAPVKALGSASAAGHPHHKP